MSTDAQPVSPAVPTGVTAADAATRSVDQLGDRPLEEHAAVFEAAHDQLRRALDDTGDAVDAPGAPGHRVDAHPQGA